MEQKKKQQYVDTLDNTAKIRYLEKLQLVGGIDPYEIAKKEWTSDNSRWPSIAYPDIVNYMVSTSSTYTMEAFKCYKSLDAHKYFTDGWVRDVVSVHVEVGSEERCLLSARVRHSQRFVNFKLDFIPDLQIYYKLL